MNKFIKEELRKARVNVPPYDDNTTELIILKSNSRFGLVKDLEIGHWYSIFVEDYVVHPSENFTLADNWNKGTVPPENRLYAQVLAINGKMVYVNSVGAVTETPWGGWLPRKSFAVAEELCIGRTQ